MATIKSALVLQDKMSSVMRSVTKTIDTMITGFEGVEKAGGKAFDPALARQMRVAVGETNAKLSEMEENYRKAAGGQQNLNNHMQRGVGIADGFLGKIKGIVAGYAGLKTINVLAGLSDEMAQTQARINLMNDGLQTTAELMDMIYKSANRSRGGFQDMATVVAKLGNNARAAFESSEEIVKFAELVQKQMKIGGTSATEAANAMLQLTQALGSGVLRGDELNSIFEQAPNLIQSVADYMGKPIGQIRKLAGEGKITADIVKKATFAAADDINKKFSAMPMTWADVLTRMKNNAVVALQPVLDQINRLANNKNVQKMLNGIASGLGVVANMAGNVLEVIGNVYNFFVENWGSIAPIIGGIALAYVTLHGAVAAYNIVQAIGNGLEMLSAAHAAISAGAKLSEAAATTTATGAQVGLNAAMLASPVTWIVLGVVALIAVLIAVCAHIAKTSKVAKSTFGVIVGGLNVVWAALKNTLAWVGDVALGIMGVIGALINNAGAVIHNGIRKADSWLYGLLSSALKVVEGICQSLNNLPFVKFDFSDISNKAAEYAEKAAAAKADKRDYVSVSDSWKAGYTTFDAFNKDWAKDAFAKGAEWGDSKWGAVKDKISGVTGWVTGGGSGATATGYLGDIANAGGKTADNTGSIANSLSATNEELSWIRDLAEREAINRFTTAEVKIDMTGMTNSITSDVDVDGMYNRFVNDVRDALKTTAAGVY